MHLLMKTHSTNPDAEVGCRVGCVQLTPKLARLILKHIKAFKAAKEADSTLYEMHFWDGSVDYLSEAGVAKIPEKVQDVLDTGEGYSKIKDSFRNVDLTEEDFERTECDIMMVRADGVSWTCIPKHSDIYISTESLPIPIIKSCLRK